MFDREVILPLILAAAVSVLAHIVVLTSAGAALLRDPVQTIDLVDLDPPDAPPKAPEREQPKPEPKQVLQLGKDDVEQRETVAWIPYEMFEKLIAPQTDTEQPALQSQADPTPQAPMRTDASNPMRLAQASPQTGLPVPTSPPSITPPGPAPPTSSKSDAPQPKQDQPALPLASADQSADPKSAPERSAPKPNDQPKSAKRAADQPTKRDQLAQASPRSGRPTRPSAPARPAPDSDRDKPTSAARSDRESPPTSIEKPVHAMRPGAVEVGKGLEIKTVAPRVGVISILTSEPKNIVCKMTFDKTGRVNRVQITQSSGYVDIDSAVESAIYKWTAKGKQLEDADGPLTVEMTIKMR